MDAARLDSTESQSSIEAMQSVRAHSCFECSIEIIVTHAIVLGAQITS